MPYPTLFPVSLVFILFILMLIHTKMGVSNFLEEFFMAM